MDADNEVKIRIGTISFCNNIAMDYGYFACLNCWRFVMFASIHYKHVLSAEKS